MKNKLRAKMAGLSEEALRQIEDLLNRRIEPLQSNGGIGEKTRSYAGHTTADSNTFGYHVCSVLLQQLTCRSAKQLNSCKGRDEPLEPVKTREGREPTSPLPTIEKLLVAGNEKLPSGTFNDWNAKKSLKLIREYDPGYETDEEEAVQTSLKRRLVLSQHLGITPTQLNIAALTLNFV
jgi:hypothetical protein